MWFCSTCSLLSFQSCLRSTARRLLTFCIGFFKLPKPVEYNVNRLPDYRHFTILQGGKSRSIHYPPNKPQSNWCEQAAPWHSTCRDPAPTHSRTHKAVAPGPPKEIGPQRRMKTNLMNFKRIVWARKLKGQEKWKNPPRFEKIELDCRDIQRKRGRAGQGELLWSCKCSSNGAEQSMTELQTHRNEIQVTSKINIKRLMQSANPGQLPKDHIGIPYTIQTPRYRW